MTLFLSILYNAGSGLSRLFEYYARSSMQRCCCVEWLGVQYSSSLISSFNLDLGNNAVLVLKFIGTQRLRSGAIWAQMRIDDSKNYGGGRK